MLAHRRRARHTQPRMPAVLPWARQAAGVRL